MCVQHIKSPKDFAKTKVSLRMNDDDIKIV